MIEEVKKYYPVVECKILVNELKFFYNRGEMHKCGMVKILAEMKENNLVKSFTEIAKLLNILIAIPMCSTEAERTYLSSKKN